MSIILKKRLLVCILIIFATHRSSSQTVGLVYPNSNHVQTEQSVFFQWDALADVLYYKFEIATNYGFVSSTLFQVYQTDTTLLALSAQTYYWRITPHFNSGNDGTTSNIRSFTIADLPSLGLSFWVRADTGVQVDGLNKVEQWNDLSGNANHAIQTVSTSKPLLTNAVASLNQHPSIAFDGNDILNTPNLGLLNTEIFMVCKGNSVNNEFFGFGSGYHVNFISLRPILYLAGSNYRYFSGLQPTGIYQFHNLSWLNGDAAAASTFLRINGTNIPYSSSVQSSGFILNNLSIGSGSLQGEMAEIIVFDNQLNSSNRSMLEAYLRSRYAPPVNLGANPLIYSFCDITLSAGTRFTSFLWSNGATTESINVNQSGTYWVQVTDIFGFVSSDTIVIDYPQIQTPTSLLYCPGDSLTWNTGLGGNPYTFLWSNGHTADSIVINTPGVYSVSVLDTNGCSRTSPLLYIGEDPFPAGVSLGPDSSMCNGNTLGLLSGESESVSFLWNTGATSPQIVVNNSGNYSVVVMNANGCNAVDTILVTIVGNAPTVQFQAQQLCADYPTQFTDQSTSGDVIQQWNWDFGLAGPPSSVQHPSLLFPGPGTYPVQLSITTDVGCSNDTTILVNIIQRPQAHFAVLDSCERGLALFTDNSLPQAGSLSAWHWDFGLASSSGDTANISNPTFSYPAPGFYQVQLVVTSSTGCSDTIIRQVQIKQSATAGFTVNKQCLNDQVQFTNTSFAGFPLNITGYKWYFHTPANDSSSIINPSFTFTQAGNYPVQLIVSTDNGCRHVFTDTLHINKFVDAAFSLPDDTLCRDVLYSVTDNSLYSNTAPNLWQWSINGQPIGSSNPQLLSSSTSGWKQVRLIVTSADNCTDSAKTQVLIQSPPIAQFTATPQVGPPPLACTFTYSGSASATQLLWNLGDGYMETGTAFAHTYTQPGLYNVMLYATDNNGCTDSSSKIVNVVTPVFEIDFSDLQCTENNGYVGFSAHIQNLSTVTITTMQIESWIQGAQPALENWNGNLYIGNTLAYQATYQLQMVEGSLLCCMRIGTVTGVVNDSVFNRTLCVPLESGFYVLPPFPNPATDHASLHVIVPQSGEAFITVSNMRGQIVSEQQIALQPGVNNVYLATTAWAGGVYEIAVHYRDERKQTRLMVLQR